MHVVALNKNTKQRVVHLPEAGHFAKNRTMCEWATNCPTFEGEQITCSKCPAYGKHNLIDLATATKKWEEAP